MSAEIILGRISDTRLRTREAAARLIAAGRLTHELTVDLIYAEIRQGSRTTINDELKLWKDEQARVDALSTALPPAVASAMLSVWALAVEQGERVFAQRGDELEAEAATAIARAGTLETAHAEVQGELRTVRGQLDDHQARLATVLAELAQALGGRDAALRLAEATAAERDAVRAQSEQALHDMRSAHLHELDALRAAHAEHDAALRAEVHQATTRLEGVQKRVMLQTEEARGAQRRAQAALSTIRQRNEQFIADVQRISAEAAEHRRLPNGTRSNSPAQWMRLAICAVNAMRSPGRRRHCKASSKPVAKSPRHAQPDLPVTRPDRGTPHAPESAASCETHSAICILSAPDTM